MMKIWKKVTILSVFVIEKKKVPEEGIEPRTSRFPLYDHYNGEGTVSSLTNMTGHVTSNQDGVK